jgi:putative methionine-R-sulfoxide reductase with GAF domain
LTLHLPARETPVRATFILTCMDFSTLDRTSVQAGPKLVPPERLRSDSPTSAVVEPVRFPPEDGGRSLSEMARRDLAATLQLLAERAQYITGASGAAIALRKDGEMVCRASAGSSAPTLGAQLHVNSGLSAESVRSRRILRCDNAELDPRVNQESCRALGISSVVVLPLIAEEDVNGVFELFSDRAYAFAERDITALERIAEMIQTAVEHAEAAERVERIVGQGAGGWDKETVNKDRERASALEAETRVAPVVRDTVRNSDALSPKTSNGTSGQTPAELQTDEHQSDGSPLVVPSERGNIGSCESCGFPVSAGRKLCLDCESSHPSDGVNAAFLSSITIPRENWLHLNRYLIGTLLIAAVTIAVLVWMR